MKKTLVFILPFFLSLPPVFAVSDEARQHYQQAYKLIDNNKLAEAEKELLSALKKEADYADAYRELGSVYYRQQLYQKALFYFRKNTRLNPNDIVGLSSLGAAYSSLNLPVLAIEILDKALSLDPDYPAAHYNLAFSYYQLGLRTRFTSEIIDKSLDHFEKYLSMTPEEKLRENDTRFLNHLKEIKSKAIADVVEKKDEIKGEDRLDDWFTGHLSKVEEIEERVNLGILLLGLDEPLEALEEFEKVLSMDKNNTNAMSLACVIYLNQGDLEKYNKLFVRFKKIDPETAEELEGQFKQGGKSK